MRSAVLWLLITAALASAVAVVEVRHRTRRAFVQLQALERERDRLQVEWGRLQLELGAWGTQDRVLRIARERLGMRTPTLADTVVVTP